MVAKYGSIWGDLSLMEVTGLRERPFEGIHLS